MGTIPVLSGKDVVRVLESLGWSVARRKGSHIVMVKQGEIATLSIPDHKEVGKGTLRSLVRSANLTMDQFIGAL
ncbi:MAG: type II toxin-antitoxin system HicA family toxin [Pseudomonadota bacterium]